MQMPLDISPAGQLVRRVRTSSQHSVWALWSQDKIIAIADEQNIDDGSITPPNEPLSLPGRVYALTW